MQPARREIGVAALDEFVPVRFQLLELGADPADEEVLEGRHPFQEEDGPVLERAIPLRQGGEEEAGTANPRVESGR